MLDIAVLGDVGKHRNMILCNDPQAIISYSSLRSGSIDLIRG